MATSITAAGPRPQPDKRFVGRHSADYSFFIIYITLIWLFVLGGFVPDMMHHARSRSAPYLVIGYVHAVTAVGWIALLTMQAGLIRRRRVRLHRKIGTGGAVFAGLLVAIGIWTVLSVHHADLGVPHTLSPSFMYLQLTDLLAFACLVAAAIMNRNNPSAHKRLVLLATLALTPAAVSRWFLPFGIAAPVGAAVHALGRGVWQTYVGIYAVNDLMIAGMCAYDWATRRRVHPALVAGATALVVAHIAASWLSVAPAMKPLATSIVAAWNW
jgi:hypothetical protein